MTMIDKTVVYTRDDLKALTEKYPIGSEVIIGELPEPDTYDGGLYLNPKMVKLIGKSLQVTRIDTGYNELAVTLFSPKTLQSWTFYPRWFENEQKSPESESGWGTVLSGAAALLMGAALVKKATSKSEDKTESEIHEKKDVQTISDT